jgi:hypothetical protein
MLYSGRAGFRREFLEINEIRDTTSRTLSEHLRQTRVYERLSQEWPGCHLSPKKWCRRTKEFTHTRRNTPHGKADFYPLLAEVGKEEFAKVSHWLVVRCACARRKQTMPPHTAPSEGNDEVSPPSPSSARQRCARQQALPRSCARTGCPRARRAGIRGTGTGSWPITHAGAAHARAAAP